MICILRFLGCFYRQEADSDILVNVKLMQIKQFPTAQFKLRLKQTAVRNVEFFFILNPLFWLKNSFGKCVGC